VTDAAGGQEDIAAQLADVRRRLWSAEAVLAVQALKARYGALVDERFALGSVIEMGALARLADRIAALFTEDGVWDGGPGLGAVTGRKAIAERLRTPTLDFSRHFFANPRIDVDPAEATARARWDLLSPCRRPDGSSWWMCGYEDDEYVSVDGTWLHRSMRLTTVFMAPVGEGWDRILS
jgi:hypothetical protein